MFRIVSFYNLIRLIFFVLLSSITANAKDYFEIEITRIIDGDSFNAIYKGFPISVRLYGIDTPEIRQEHGKEAKLALESLLNSQETIIIELIYLDNYRRAVSIINIKNSSIQEELLKAGHAWFSEQYCKLPICDKWKELEYEAKINQLGLWENEFALPPWDYRKSK